MIYTDFIVMLYDMIQCYKSHEYELGFELVCFDNPSDRLIGFSSYYEKDGFYYQQFWQIKIRDLDYEILKDYFSSQIKRMNFCELIENPHQLPNHITDLLLIHEIHEL